MKKETVDFKKLDMDDILEIIIEHFQESNREYQKAKGVLLGTPDENLRFIGAFGKLDNPEIEKCDLEVIDESMDYNGDHSFIKSHPECQLTEDSNFDNYLQYLNQQKWSARLRRFFCNLFNRDKR